MKTARKHIMSCLISVLAFAATGHAETDTDLTNLPLESLMELKVTSVSKKTQSVTNAAAAVFVITQEDIRRSGVTTIADALRMVPGVQVARIDGSKWAVSSRGFNGRFSNKLLVLMDGRSLYTPYFMGVYWEVQDTVLDDIDRIEVIRGPGAALWGTNAVNGVINIITKSAENTKGTLLSAGGGTYDRAFASARIGTELSDNSSARLYAKHQLRDSFADERGNDGGDGWHMSQLGFRMDTHRGTNDTITLQGDYYDGRIKETYLLYDHPSLSASPHKHYETSSNVVSGGNIIARWQRTVSDTGAMSLQAYFDHSEYGMLVSPQTFNTVDLDFQHRFSPTTPQEIVWGLGYRHYQYGLNNTSTVEFSSTSVTNDIFSAFVHDEIAVIPSKLSLIVGSRLEHSYYSGYSFQPNGRLLWSVTPYNSIWTSVSRAIRSATRGEQNIDYNYRSLPANTAPNQPVPLRLEIVGNPNFKSEELLAYEIGYRTELMPQLSFDLALYYNDYSNLRVVSSMDGYAESVAGSIAWVKQYMLSNDMHGRAIGVELAADWAPLDWWRLQAAYSYQNFKMYLNSNSTDETNKGNAEGGTPQHQVSLRSGFNLSRTVTLDIWLRGTDRIASIDNISIPGYLAMDVRVAWKPVKNLELSIVGQNLLDSHHPEFIPEYINTLPTEVVRSAYGKITYKF